MTLPPPTTAPAGAPVRAQARLRREISLVGSALDTMATDLGILLDLPAVSVEDVQSVQAELAMLEQTSRQHAAVLADWSELTPGDALAMQLLGAHFDQVIHAAASQLLTLGALKREFVSRRRAMSEWRKMSAQRRLEKSKPARSLVAARS
jgi:hypothetical protein